VVRCRFLLLRPRHSGSSGGCALLINLCLQGGVTLKLGNIPDRGSSHGMISDWGSVLELGVEVKGTYLVGGT
jgi:hypothetical protein